MIKASVGKKQLRKFLKTIVNEHAQDIEEKDLEWVVKDFRKNFPAKKFRHHFTDGEIDTFISDIQKSKYSQILMAMAFSGTLEMTWLNDEFLFFIPT